MVDPIQISASPFNIGVGLPFTVTGAEGLDIQPEFNVKVKVAIPWLMAVTTPELLMVATAGLELVQVPPEEGVNVVVPPTHIAVAPVIVTSGLSLTFTCSEGRDTQPEEVCVKVKVALPLDTPVTIPELLTVATKGLLLDHTPPVEGESVVVVPTQIDVEPVTSADCPITVTGLEGSEEHPSVVYVNVTVPAEIAVTIPLLVIVATKGLELVHEPPLDGVIAVV